MSFDIEKFKIEIVKDIFNYIIQYNKKESDNLFKDKVNIDGIFNLQLFKNISLFGSKPRNILFLDDYHKISNTKRNIEIFTGKELHLHYESGLSIYNFRILLYEYIIIYINKLTSSNEDKIKYIRELFNYVNDRLYKTLSIDLYKKENISIDELLYDISTDTENCLDIFIFCVVINITI